MCSIAGYTGPADPQRDCQFFALLRHRGPDEEKSVGVDDWVLLHQRLSIVDLSPLAGQPMQWHGNWLIFNGEIYNHPELRAAHLADAPLRSTSDTEVLLHLLDRHGLRILHELNGMFAFAWYEARTRTLHLVRDRFGVKPLYWTQRGNEFAFASEIKPLLRWRGEVCWNHPYIQTYLQHIRTDDGPQTLDQHIQQVPAGCRLEIAGRSATLRRWYQFADAPPTMASRSFAETADRFEELLVDAIRLRLRAAVPLALTLSGGLDSTTVYVLARQRLQANIQPFTLVRPGFLDDESSLARGLANQFGDTLREVTGPPSIEWDSALAGLWALEFPGISIGAGGYLEVYRAVQRDGYRVVLEGHGGDELLGGYPLHVQAAWRTQWASGNWRAAFALYQRQQQLSHADLRPRQHRTPIAWRFLRDARRQRVAPGHFERVLRESFERTTLPLILREFDRLPMACSVESRSPFMDYRVVEFARALPLEHKINPTGTKAILRHILRQHGATAVAAVPWKIPFTTNLLRFVAAHASPLRDAIGALDEPHAQTRAVGLGLLDKEALTWHEAQFICRAAAVRLTQQMYADWLSNTATARSAAGVEA